ncbi:SMR domain-containing protein At5g58720 isoform X1 [Glycine max]|uniref:SMR domain-containing protein At5g58720 isoform X1 n=1 Tax=Glycine max TaxID=3847 RepID=UPI0003DE80F2|nr:SMR domain-containing protein At5g58720 isoform X1 [Glycine max]|eukprot:XP_006591213.1 SMR domain-containing protein At5g58720 isoform X1 [Glycine max]
MKNPRKKKRPKPQKKLEKNKGVVAAAAVVAENENENEEEKRKRSILEALVEAFSLSSVREASMAYNIAGGDPDRASEILRKGFSDRSEDSFSCFSYGSSSSSSSSSGLELGSKGGWRQQQQQKKMVASTGTVSTVLGKEYVRRNNNNIRNKGLSSNGVFEMEEAEQFLCSMLGDDSDINLAVVRDVLCQCGNDIERASDILLDLAASTNEKPNTARHPNYGVDNIDDERFFADPNDSLIDRRLECTSLSWEGYLSNNPWSVGSFGRKYAEVLNNSKANSAVSPGCTKSEIPQKVLESLFNIPKSTEHDKNTMNWRNVVKKIQSLGPGFYVSPHVAESQQRTCAKGDEYHVFREDSRKQWDSVKSYYTKAATAYTKRERAYAAYLSDQGKEQTKLAQKADTKASHDIFVASGICRNKGIENVITIDLHGQHVKQAMRMLKLHLLFGSYVPSVQTLRVITGCGSHGVGKSKLKQSVINLLDREAIEWREENRGTVLIKLSRWREYSFLDTSSDSDSND